MLGFQFGGLDMISMVFWVGIVGLTIWLLTLPFVLRSISSADTSDVEKDAAPHEEVRRASHSPH